MLNPLCQICNRNARTSLADHVHHKETISSGITELEKEQLAYNPKNLLSVCIQCHVDIHVLLKKDYKKYYKLMDKFTD